MIRRISSANSVPDPFGATSGHHTVASLSDHPLGTETAPESSKNWKRKSLISAHSRNASLTTHGQSTSSGLNVHLESAMSNSCADLEIGAVINSSPSNVSVPSYMSSSPTPNAINDLPCVFPNPPSEQLICPLCSKVFFDPVISQCGHTFCRRCIDDGGDKVLCPIDGTGLVIVTSNLAVSEQVSQLEILCRYGLTEAEVSDPNGKLDTKNSV